MKRQAQEVYGYGRPLPTRRFPTARVVLVIIVAATLAGALW